MSTISVWGIDHGEEIAKAFATDPNTGKKPSTGRKVAGTFAGGYHPLIAGKKGKKLRAVGNTMVGSGVGALAGGATGAMLMRGRTSGALAGAAGAWGGSLAGMNRNQKKGYLKTEA